MSQTADHHLHHHSSPERRPGQAEAQTASPERWLIVDVGAGTQDILFYDPLMPLEGCYKLVLPSPSLIAAQKIRAATLAGRDVWLYGSLMGGGSLPDRVRDHLAAGRKVFAQPQAALSLHDDLDRVQALGVELSQDKPPETTPVACGDVDLHSLGHALEHFGLSLPRRFAAAAQDHGFSPKSSNRARRFALWEEFLAGGGRPADLIYRRPPSDMTRLIALTEALPGAIVADSATAALLGALQDPVAAAARAGEVMVVNVGNGHTVAFLVKGERVTGVYEHHTGLLNPELLADHLDRFRRGALGHQEVVEANGHGCRVAEAGRFETVVVTGPNRHLAKGLGREAVVHGDMMLSGCFGLLEGARLIGALKP